MEVVRLRITGLVQGVGYRAWAMRRAQALGLTGWVRNRLDNSVELLAGGDPATLRQLAADCRAGPRSARVAAVEERPESDAGPLPSPFTQWPTA